VLAGSDVPLEGLTRIYQPDSLNSLAPQVIKMRVEKLLIKEQPIAFRAPKLRKRVLELADTSFDTSAFLDELVQRDLPLFVIQQPNSDAPSARAFGDVTALPVYIDVIAAHWAAADLKLAPQEYAPAPADPRPLIKHLVNGKLGLALGAFRDRETPVYAVLPPDIIGSAATRLRL
jgi:hypothetical protein